MGHSVDHVQSFSLVLTRKVLNQALLLEINNRVLDAAQRRLLTFVVATSIVPGLARAAGSGRLFLLKRARKRFLLRLMIIAPVALGRLFQLVRLWSDHHQARPAEEKARY